jgi:S-adenosylmethionine hydrolase
MAVIALTTDFGLTDPYVGIVKGVLATRAPGATVIDLTHGIPPQDVLAGALVLRHAAPYFPPGTIHLAVVDPGVGGTRRPICIETDTALFVAPDNGLCSLAAPPERTRRVVHLTDERFFLAPRSTTFHGRDVFAPVAAALATGTPPEALGPPVSDPVRIAVPPVETEPGRLRGAVLYVDRFGNLVTNIEAARLAAFPRRAVSTTIGGVQVRGIATAYADVERGALLAVIGSWGLLEIARRDGSAAGALGVGVGAPVVVEGPTT